MRKIIRWWLPLAISGTALLGVSAAHAAKPVVQGCVGESISALAQDPNNSHLAKGLAQNDTKGVGVEIQALQAGDITDIPNTCQN